MKGKEQIKCHFPASVDSLRPFLLHMKEWMLEWTSDEKMIRRVEVALEEFFVNIVYYAYQDHPPAEIVVQGSVLPDQRLFLIQLIDSGKPFDPLQKLEEESAKLQQPVEPGGHGIKIASQFVDKMDYKRSDGRNILSLYKSY